MMRRAQPLDFLGVLAGVAATNPAHPALVEPGQPAISYGALLEKVDHLAARYAAAGAGPEQVIGLCLPRSTDLVIAMLAAWRAGAAFLPLDPRLPPKRLRWMIEDAEVPLLVATAKTRTRLAGLERPVLEPSVVESLHLAGSTREMHPSSALAYLIYTSGSTGQPKGVQVTHRGVVGFLAAQIEAFALRPDSRSLWVLSPSFDASISDVGTALLSGATLCVGPDGILEGDLMSALREHHITHVDLPPALLALLDVDEIPDSLQTVIIGGEVCPPRVVRRWASRLRLVNVYGPTEATVCTSLVICDPDWSRPLIGRPIPGVRYAVLDETMSPVSHGSVGELFIGGDALARGYHRRPELEASKFPIIGGERMFRTGDRVFLHDDGQLEFRGRLDRQLKIRGRLVAPEEIEARLLLHPGVRAAAVVATGGPYSSSLVAYVEVVDSQARPDPRQLEAALRADLPPWLVPRSIVILDRLPTSASGKIDHGALLDIRPQSGGTVPARSPSEEALVRAVSAVLGIADVGTERSFVDLGGDSLSALQVAFALRALGLPLTPRDLLEPTTLAQLSARRAPTIDARSTASLDSQVPAVPIFVPNAPPKDSEHSDILITGATGFLGRRLLQELLERTSSHIHCLVRSADSRARLQAQLTPPQAARCSEVRGDLSQRHLGLSDHDWARLAERVGVVHHVGAEVNLVSAYDALAPANVGGTHEVLAFLAAGRRKRLHYASTLSVLVATDRAPGRLLEADHLDDSAVVLGGYAQSKWVAERALHHARRAGMPGLSIYRFGLITADSRTGRSPPNDPFRRFLDGLITLGTIPEGALDLSIDVTPVDYAAAATAHLSLAAEPSTFHIANPRSLTMGALVDALREAGVDLRVVSSDEWRHIEITTANEASSYFALCRASSAHDFFRHLDLFLATGFELDQSNTQAGLIGSGLSCPLADRRLIATYLADLASRPT